MYSSGVSICTRSNGSHFTPSISRSKRLEIQEAKAGDLIAVSGMEDIFVGETVTPIDHQDSLPVLHIDEPTLQMTFIVNNSPFAGREGKFVTARKIEERLMAQLQTDVSLRVDPIGPDSWIVSGRGELHLSILIENMLISRII